MTARRIARVNTEKTNVSSIQTNQSYAYNHLPTRLFQSLVHVKTDG